MALNWQILRDFLVTFKRPLALVLESTNACNANCSMCSREALSRKTGKMDFPLFKKIVEDARRTNISTFQLSFYGECLLDAQLAEKIKYIHATIPDAWVQIVTNGSLLTYENSSGLLEAGISEIRVSIEGNNKNEYETIRRGLKFDQLVNNLSDLKKLRDAKKSNKTRIVVTGLNLKEFPLDEVEYKKFWAKYADIVHVRDEHLLNLEKKESFLQKVLPCDHLFTMLPVHSDGQCTICIYDWYGKAVYNTLANNTIRRVWFDPKFTFYRILHLLGLKKMISICRHCAYRANYKKLIRN